MIKEIDNNDLKYALELVNNVFSEFVAVGYSEQGKNTFINYLKNKEDEVASDLKTGHKKMWAYYQDDVIIGVISTRDISHISLMFVDKRYHCKGIARKMFDVVLEEVRRFDDITQITVNSSPYAVGVYEHLGFRKVGEQQEIDGIIFIPMARTVLEWSRVYNQNTEPTLADISEFIKNSLWQDINSFLQETYKIEPKKEYSDCSMQRGWNIKYKKGGKSLCTLYPMEGYFIALVVVGKNEINEVEFLLQTCSEYTQNLYNKTGFYIGGKWLMLHVTNEEILDDMKTLIQIKVKPKLPKTGA